MVYYEWYVEHVREAEAIRKEKNARTWKTTDGEVNKLEYLSDLYKILEENLREVRKRIQKSKDRESIYKLLHDKNSIMNELRDGGANVVIIRDELHKTLVNLRFQDGTSVEEAFNEWKVKKEMERMEKVDHEKKDENKEDSDQDSEVSEGEMNDKFGEEVQDNQSDKTESLVDELSEEEHQVNRQIDDEKLEELVNQENNIKKQREEFKAKIADLPEDRQREMLQQFDDKMKALRRELEQEANKQDASLKAKLAERERRRKAAKESKNEKVIAKEEAIIKLEEEINEIEMDIDKVNDKGINTKKHKQEI